METWGLEQPLTPARGFCSACSRAFLAATLFRVPYNCRLHEAKGGHACILHCCMKKYNDSFRHSRRSQSWLGNWPWFLAKEMLQFP